METKQEIKNNNNKAMLSETYLACVNKNSPKEPDGEKQHGYNNTISVQSRYSQGSPNP